MDDPYVEDVPRKGFRQRVYLGATALDVDRDTGVGIRERAGSEVRGRRIFL